MTIATIDSIRVMTVDEARQATDAIKSGLVELRQLFLDVYERDGWKALGYSNFIEYAETEFDYGKSRAYQLIDAATVERNLRNSTVVENHQIPERHLRPLVSLPPDVQPIAYNEAVTTAPNGKVTAAHVETVVRRFVAPEPPPVDDDEQYLDDLAEDADGYDWTDDEPLHTAFVGNQSVQVIPSPPPDVEPIGDEYYTPPYILDAARSVLGVIDLDPATSDKAQSVVMAREYYTKDDDGLTQDWHGKVWLNPPFSAPKPFVDKLIAEYTDGNVSEAIILVNNGTETAWGQALLTRFPVCFVGFGNGRGTRISFWNDSPDNPEKGNRYAQMICYLGEMPERFYAAFAQFGAIMEPK